MRVGRRALLAGLASGWAFAALARPVRADKPVTLVAYGDSLIHGYGLAPGDALPARLEEALRAEGETVTVVNAGNSGDTSASGLARLDWTLAERPDAVLLCLGANDGLRGLSPAETEANLRKILERLKTDKVPVLLAGMLAPRNLGPEYAEEFDALYPRLAEEFDTLFYPFLLEGVALDPTLNQDDGIHPNAAGVAVIVKGLLPFAAQLVDRAEAGGPA